MRVFRFFLNFEKEEKWLEHMALQGYQLKGHKALYRFEAAPPEQANIKIDYRIFKKQQDFEDYRSLFEDSGWLHIAGTKSSGNQYFKRMDENSGEDIFSDTASRAGRYKRLSEMMLFCFVVFLPFLLPSIWKPSRRLTGTEVRRSSSARQSFT